MTYLVDALQHDLTVATWNTRDFNKTSVKVLNPFA
jgi:predicted nucleic acid-binding protein